MQYLYTVCVLVWDVFVSPVWTLTCVYMQEFVTGEYQDQNSRQTD